jgi:hypothetical protein
MARKELEPPQVVPKEFASVDEVQRAIAKLERRVKQLQMFHSRPAVFNETGAENLVASDVRETIREVFGTNSPEFQEHEHLTLWGGPMFANMPHEKIVAGVERGRLQTIGILRGLTDRLKEKLEDFGSNIAAPATYFDKLNFHRRIHDVTRDFFLDGHHSGSSIRRLQGTRQYGERTVRSARSRWCCADENRIFTEKSDSRI